MNLLLWLLGAALAGMLSTDASDPREIMMENHLKGRGIRNARVLEAMRTVPREAFVPETLRNQAYGDHPLPIGHGQTISQPYIVAYMTEILDPKPGDRILEIGTGSGYQAAILAKLVKDVYTVEIIEPLSIAAQKAIQEMGLTNVHFRVGDGYQGWEENAPFDGIIVTCAPDNVPSPVWNQLKEGGRMVIPLGPAGSVQKLVVLEKKNGEPVQRTLLPVQFVPMTGEAER